MKKIYSIFFGLAVTLLLTGCAKVSNPTADDLVISWKVISNEYFESPRVKARFSITNNSASDLKPGSWELFYNQMPRDVIVQPEQAEITRISGDWYKLVPGGGLVLKAGETVELEYESQAFIIKETDSPLGLYMVFYDKTGNQTSVEVIKNYTIDAFERPEQINRHKRDAEPIPDGAILYDQNLQLSEIAEEDLPVIVPSPFSVQKSGQSIQFDAAPKVLYQKGLENEARYLAAHLGQLSGTSVSPMESNASEPGSIYLSIDKVSVNNVNKEAYRLSINENKSITITGSDNAGVFYGIQSLMALTPIESISQPQAPVSLPVIKIEDAPRFGFRSLHIDVARNFQTKETVKKMLDLMAHYKLNHFMFILSEDEAWRLEIDALPELTEVGSKRGHTIKASTDILHPAYGSGPFPDAPGTYGSGYYTREDFIEILQYARDRHITVIPTINLPGHSRAAIRAMESRYQKFMAEGNEEKANEFRLIDPDDQSVYSGAQSFDDNIVCVARESVYRFYETVIDAIIGMYNEAGIPLELFHTGGDEVPEGAWAGSPLCLELMKSMPEITDPKNLQAVFFQRAVEILKSKGLKIGGWEEVGLFRNTEGKLIPNPEFANGDVIPWVWNNLGHWADLSYRMANAGYPVVMCDVSNFYLDLAYSKDPKEPGLYWGGFVNARSTWQFAPYNSFITNLKSGMGHPIDPEQAYAGLERLRAENAGNIVGLQAQLWGETIKGNEMLEYYALPKMIGFAETAWAKERPWEKQKNVDVRKKQMDEGWNIFANTLGKRELPKLSKLFGGYNYRIPQPGSVIENGILNANVEYPGLTIRYTTDGSEPTIQSTLYSSPTEVSGEVKLKAFDKVGRSSRTISAVIR